MSRQTQWEYEAEVEEEAKIMRLENEIDRLREALKRAIVQLEDGEGHDEGAFDDSCDVCVLLHELRPLVGEQMVPAQPQTKVLTVGMATAMLAAIGEDNVSLTSPRRRDVQRMWDAAMKWKPVGEQKAPTMEELNRAKAQTLGEARERERKSR